MPTPSVFVSKHRHDSLEYKIEASFHKFDADGNGSLDMEEFSKAFKDAVADATKHGVITPDLKHAGVGMGLDRHSHAGKHTIVVSNIVKDNSVMRDGRIQAGDRITHVNGKEAKDWPIRQVLDEIIGPCGSDINFTVMQENGSTPISIELKRGTPIYWYFMDIIQEKDNEIERLKRLPDDLVHAGVGITFDKVKNNLALVQSILKDGSAWRDGRIKVGDEILKVDGRDILSFSHGEVVDCILGPYGTQITLTVKHQGNGKAEEVHLVRGSPVYWYFYDENAKLLGKLRELEDREADLVREWEVRMQTQIAQLERDHQAAMAAMKLEQADAIGQKDREKESALLNQLNEHNQAMADAASKHQKDLEGLNLKLQTQHNKDMEDFNQKLQAQVDGLAKKDRENEASLLKQLNEHNKAMADAAAKHKTKLENLNQQLQAQADGLGKKDRENEASLLKQLNEHNQAMTDAAAKHNKDLENLNKKLLAQAEQCRKEMMAHSNALAEVTLKHENDLHSLNLKFQAQAEQHRKEVMAHSNALSELTTKHEKEMQALADQHKKEMLQHSTSLAELTAKHQKEMQALMKETDTLKLKLAELQRQLQGLQSNTCKAELQTAKAELARLLEELKRLGELNGALKMKIGELERQIQGLQNDKSKGALEAAAAKAELDRLQEELKRLHELNGRLEHKVGDFDRERKTLEGQIKEAKDIMCKVSGMNHKLQGELLENSAAREHDVEKLKDLDKLNAKVRELESALLLSSKTIKDLEDCIQLLKPDNERLTEFSEQSKVEITRLRALKSDMLSKYAGMERNLQDQVFDLMDERNSYRGELEHFYSLPNPCGVGLGLRATEVLDSYANTTTSTVTVIDIIPGMSSAQSGMIAIGDYVLEVDGMSASGKTTDELKTIIAGKRGTRINITFKRAKDKTDYTLVLKRGAWGPEHCAASPEHMDMVDQNSWPEVTSRTAVDKSLHSTAVFKGDY